MSAPSVLPLPASPHLRPASASSAASLHDREARWAREGDVIAASMPRGGALKPPAVDVNALPPDAWRPRCTLDGEPRIDPRVPSLAFRGVEAWRSDGAGGEEGGYFSPRDSPHSSASSPGRVLRLEDITIIKRR